MVGMASELVKITFEVLPNIALKIWPKNICFSQKMLLSLIDRVSLSLSSAVHRRAAIVANRSDRMPIRI
jgi:hypothetical protein